jgi:citronellol/citronellal dehydrogenase
MELKGKVGIVTGASRGIGKAIAIGLAKNGMNVVVAARSESERDERLPGTIHETVRQIELEGGKALAVRCDVTNEESVAGLIERSLARFGQIDALVNNAGIAFPSSVVDMPVKRWELVFRVNLTGAFLCARAVLPIMIKKGRGSIINISSLAANERDGGTVSTGLAYGVAKAGLDRFTWGLAAEVGRWNVAVNCIKPHRVIKTEGMDFQVQDEELKKDWVSPEKMVKCAVFLAGQDAKGVSGIVATDEELSAWHGL